MDAIRSLIKGFLLGIGFALGMVLVSVYYFRFVDAGSRVAAIHGVAREIAEESNAVKATLLSFDSVDGGVVVSGVISNSGTEPMIYVAPRMEIVAKDGRVKAVCEGKPVKLLKGGDSFNFQEMCRSIIGNISGDVDKVVVSAIVDVR